MPIITATIDDTSINNNSKDTKKDIDKNGF